MIGSHNSFTYKRGVRWWMRLLRPVARCQRRGLTHQGDGWCAMYDMRLRVYRGHICVSHGPVVYGRFIDAERELLEHGRRHGRVACVRVLLEGRWTTSQLVFLEGHMKHVRGVRYVCGRRRRDWRKVLDLPEVDVEQRGTASMGGPWWAKVWPWLWWRTRRRELAAMRQAARGSERYELFDFV